jgi:8-oxo-dGTP diphosphatase
VRENVRGASFNWNIGAVSSLIKGLQLFDYLVIPFGEVTAAVWRSHPSSLPLGAAGFFWLDGGAIAGGCFPAVRKRARENETDYLRREIREELPKLKLGRLRLWKEVKAKNRHTGRKMSNAIFIAKKASGRLAIGDKPEIDHAMWRKPRGIRLAPTTRYIRNKLFPN